MSPKISESLMIFHVPTVLLGLDSTGPVTLEYVPSGEKVKEYFPASQEPITSFE